MNRDPSSGREQTLSEQDVQQLAGQLVRLFEDEFDRDLSEFHARTVVTFCAERLAPLAYNRGIADVRRALESQLDDLEAELVREPPPR